MKKRPIQMIATTAVIILLSGCAQRTSQPINSSQWSLSKKIDSSNLFNHIANGNIEQVKELTAQSFPLNIQNASGMTPLIESIRLNDLPMIKLLLAQGANVNYADRNGEVPLMYVVKNCNKAVPKTLDNGTIVYIDQEGSVNRFLIDHLIASGADINAQDSKHQTVLIKAAISGNTDAVKMFIHHNADINYQDLHGKTALMYAALNGNSEAAHVLVNAKSDLNALDDVGQTALIIAAQNGFTDIVRLLVKNGADVKIRDQFGATALKLAELREYKEITNLILKAGGID